MFKLIKAKLNNLINNPNYCRIILITWIIILSFLYSCLSVLRHMHFQSGAFDLGIFDQSLWQYSHFLSPINTIKGKLILGDHLNLTMPLLSPLYWVWKDVRILLIFQAVFISLSTYAVYKISLIRKLTPFVSLCLSFAYSIFYGIQFAVYFDFHPIVIGLGLLVWLIYFFEYKKWKMFIFILVLTLLTQEDLGLALSAVGLIYFFKKGYRRFALLFITIGIVSSLLAMKVIGLLSPTGLEYTPHISSNIFQVAKSLFDDPQKTQTWFYTLISFSFLPIFSPGSILAITLNLSQFFATGVEFSRMWSPFMHHRAILSVFVFLGTLETFSLIKKINKSYLNQNLIAFILILSVFFQQFIFHFPLNKLSKYDYWKTQSWMLDNEKLYKHIPQNYSIASAQNLVPHLSQRKEIYLLYPRIKNIKGACNNCWWLESCGKPEYMVLDLHPNQWITQLLETNENFNSAVKNMEKTGKIVKLKNINYALLYKINY